MYRLLKFVGDFRNITPKTPYSTKVKLGRWNMDNNKRTELKIYYANEDHCGVCSDIKSQAILQENYQMKQEEYYKAFII